MHSSNRILLWGALPSIPKDEEISLSLKRSGGNFGNMLIGNGIVSVLTGYDFMTRSQFNSPEEVNEKCCHIVIPAANFLWKDFDFGFMADFIEKTSIPITIVGLGAQTKDRAMVSKIHPNTLRLVKIISERTKSIGVRGHYTAEVLAANGILNVSVLGCPSLFTKGMQEINIKKTDPDTGLNLAVNFSRRVCGHSFNSDSLKNIENKLLKLAIKTGATFIAQDEVEELSLCINNDDAGADQITKYFNQTTSPDVLSFFMNNTKYFCNVNEWSDCISNCWGSIGSRLHGNIIALINGIPALSIVHDSRTLEVCALFGIPYLHVGDEGCSTLTENDLLDRLISSDFDLFKKNYRQIFKRYKTFLSEQGLSHSL